MTDLTHLPEKPALDREAIALAPNPLRLDGIEFIEYATAKPQALGQVLETMGFRPAARHRSREVMLYRQRGVKFVESRGVHSEGRGTLSRTSLGSVSVKLVHDPR